MKASVCYTRAQQYLFSDRVDMVIYKHCTLICTPFYLYHTEIATSHLKALPTIYAITPTYARSTQRVDLTSLCHTLMHVPQITWIVVEDSINKTQPVMNLLAKCKSVTSVHLTAKSTMDKGEGRGTYQRNTGLSWIRQNCSSNTTTLEKCRGVVYLMDDDNKYNLRLFHEVGWTRSRVAISYY
jgi:galactosylgalactosylxylosylprotein 3-beta-glucuronosyltransferase 3